MKRLGLVSIVVAMFGCGCGGTPTIITDDGSTNPGDMSVSPTNPDLSMPSSGGCGTEGSACTVSALNGLCRSNNCLPCTDVTDDATCAASYGAGKLCLGGTCSTGCRDASTCNGQICDSGSNQCRACTQDAECPGSAPNCDTTSGKCTATAPTCSPTNTACGSGGWCCSAVCYSPVNPAKKPCCLDTDCTGTGASCNMASHLCNPLPSNCPAAKSATKWYVNPDAPDAMSGKGSSQCPYQTLSGALDDLAKVATPLPAGFTLCVTGTFDSTSDSLWPRIIPAGVELNGIYCTDNDATPKGHTIFKVPTGNSGVYMTGAGASSIHGFDITLQGATKTSDGIFIANTSSSASTDRVTVYDVTVKNFQHGISVNKRAGDTNPGHAYIIHDSQFNANTTGLYMDNGSTVEVQVQSATTSRAEFDSNDNYGIYVAGASNLTLKGAVFVGTGATANSLTVRSDFNQVGVYVSSETATRVSIDHFSASQNTGVGIETSNTATLSMTNSEVLSNGSAGFKIYASPISTMSAQTVNLGTTPTGSTAGKNTFANNTGAGICVAFDDTTGVLNAMGNTFGTTDCSTASPGNIKVGTNCTTALDAAGTNGGSKSGTLLLVANCGKIDCTAAPKPAGCP